MMKFWDVYVETGRNNVGYSVFVEAKDESEALEMAKKSFEEDDDINLVKAITEISQEQYLASLPDKPRYGVEVSYSWGDIEDEPYGSFETKEQAYEFACQLAGKEAYIQNEEFLPENTCYIIFDANSCKIDLHYDYDDTWCFYRIVKLS